MARAKTIQKNKRIKRSYINYHFNYHFFVSHCINYLRVAPPPARLHSQSPLPVFLLRHPPTSCCCSALAIFISFLSSRLFSPKLSAHLPSPLPFTMIQLALVLFFFSTAHCSTQSLNYTSTRPVTSFDSGNPVHSSLFSNLAATPAPASSLGQYRHPRVLFDPPAWQALIARYANPVHVANPDSWTNHLRKTSILLGPTSSFLKGIASLDVSAYKGATEDLSDMTTTSGTGLQTLADKILGMNEANSHGLFLCAMWAAINEAMTPEDQFLPLDTRQMCINATVKWATILLAHHINNCGSACPKGTSGPHSSIWNTAHRFTVSDDWKTSGMSMSLAYDVLYNDMTVAEQVTVRSALTLLVMNKFSWGNTATSDRNSPNAELHPHRIFSNWATYHSNLYLPNLAIAGETGFDRTTTALLAGHGVTGYNHHLHRRFSKMLVAYCEHSIYPDGSTFEDGYTYFIALREGALGLLAAERRGYKCLSTPRFKGLIHNLVQMSEPWHCGRVIGHASGGGLSYPAYTALFRFMYPKGSLPLMAWRHRHGNNFANNNPCRTVWFQTLTQMAVLGGEHDETVTSAISPEGMTNAQKVHMPTSYFAPRRGLLVGRNDWTENASFFHFDARPDAFFPGHDNADRGVFTFSGLRQTWLDDLAQWRYNVDSRVHSLLHVDGLAEDEKAPSVPMFRAVDDGTTILAAADLTYAYNIQWARNWPDSNPPRRNTVTYNNITKSKSLVSIQYVDKEEGDPRDFGWPSGDNGADIGLTRSQSNLWGDADVGFMGMYTWKRAYRENPLDKVVRSTGFVRTDPSLSPGLFMVVDSINPGGSLSENHIYESYLILDDDVEVDPVWTFCAGPRCRVRLVKKGATESDSPKAEILVATPNNKHMWQRVEKFTTEKEHTRVVITCVANGHFQMWHAMHAYTQSNPNGLLSFGWHYRNSRGVMRMDFMGMPTMWWWAEPVSNALEKTTDPRISPSPSESPTPSGSPKPSVTPSISSSQTMSPSTCPTPSESASASASPMPSESSSPQASMTAPASPTGSSAPSVSSTSSPSPMSAPMEPRTLSFKNKVTLKKGDLISNRETFFAPVPPGDINENFQSVFKIEAQSLKKLKSRRKVLMHYISTCFKKTNVNTRLSVYNCGGDEESMDNYNNRNCSVVALGREIGSCGGKHGVLTDVLEAEEVYLVVVSSEKQVKRQALKVQYRTKKVLVNAE